MGGIEIPHTRGLLGHSDADVLIHAICDAILGALCLGDIGMHFPDTDIRYKDKESSYFLSEVSKLVTQNGYTIGNIDSMIALEKPKIAPYIPAMKQKIAQLVQCNEDQVSIKASTTEKLGFIGREEGVTAFANVLLTKNDI